MEESSGPFTLVDLPLTAFRRLPTLATQSGFVAKTYEDYAHLGHLTTL